MMLQQQFSAFCIRKMHKAILQPNFSQPFYRVRSLYDLWLHYITVGEQFGFSMVWTAVISIKKGFTGTLAFHENKMLEAFFNFEEEVS